MSPGVRTRDYGKQEGAQETAAVAQRESYCDMFLSPFPRAQSREELTLSEVDGPGREGPPGQEL